MKDKKWRLSSTEEVDMCSSCFCSTKYTSLKCGKSECNTSHAYAKKRKSVDKLNDAADCSDQDKL